MLTCNITHQLNFLNVIPFQNDGNVGNMFCPHNNKKWTIHKFFTLDTVISIMHLKYLLGSYFSLKTQIVIKPMLFLLQPQFRHFRCDVCPLNGNVCNIWKFVIFWTPKYTHSWIVHAMILGQNPFYWFHNQLLYDVVSRFTEHFLVSVLRNVWTFSVHVRTWLWWCQADLWFSHLFKVLSSILHWNLADIYIETAFY